MASGGGVFIAISGGASILGGTESGTSGAGVVFCGARDGLGEGVTSWKLRSSIGAALRFVNPKNWDRALTPARHSSFTDAVRARRVAVDDFGAATADSGG